jgi:hypothetical protein
MQSIIFIFFGILSSTTAALASENFDKACNSNNPSNPKNTLYLKLTSSIIYYGLVLIPLVMVFITYLVLGIKFEFNFEYIWFFCSMLVGYSGVIVFDMLSREHVDVFLFNVIYQLQIVFMFIVKFVVFGQGYNIYQLIGIAIIVGSIMYIAGYNARLDNSQIQRSKTTIVGIIFVILAAMFRGVALIMDGHIATKAFSTLPVSDFAPQWWLYECITFVGPATIVLTIQYLIYFTKQQKQNPIQLIKTEITNLSYPKATAYSFAEYISGVPTIAHFPYFGPVFQGLVPICGLAIEVIRGKKIDLLVVWVLCLFLIGCGLLAIV